MSRIPIAFDFSTAIALVSFLVSAVTLFFSLLRAPKISKVVGPEFKVYYPPDGGFGVYLPVAFLNESPRTGTVLRCSLSIYRKSTPEERFFMDWRSFCKLEGNSWAIKEPAHAITVPGMQSRAKIVLFSWRAASIPQIQIAEGSYVMVFHYWTGLAGKPRNAHHEFAVDKGTKAELDGYLATKQGFVVDLVLDQKIGSNKLLTGYGSQSLLGS
jgi:hypothetical protein